MPRQEGKEQIIIVEIVVESASKTWRAQIVSALLSRGRSVRQFWPVGLVVGRFGWSVGLVIDLSVWSVS